MTLTAFALQAVACGVTFASMWKIGDKSKLGPALGIAACLSFFVLNLYVELWFVAAMCAVQATIHTRNFIKWRREEKT